MVGRKQLRGNVEEGKDMWAGETKKKMKNVVLVTSPHQRLWFPEKSKKGRRTAWAEQGLRKQRNRDKGMGSWRGMGGRRGPSGVDWAAPGRMYGGRSDRERR